MQYDKVTVEPEVDDFARMQLSKKSTSFWSAPSFRVVLVLDEVNSDKRLKTSRRALFWRIVSNTEGKNMKKTKDATRWEHR
jgi:Leu/Phe-tRNA-protein transferase